MPRQSDVLKQMVGQKLQLAQTDPFAPAFDMPHDESPHRGAELKQG